MKRKPKHIRIRILDEMLREFGINAKMISDRNFNVAKDAAISLIRKGVGREKIVQFLRDAGMSEKKARTAAFTRFTPRVLRRVKK